MIVNLAKTLVMTIFVVLWFVAIFSQ